ncbi:AN1-type zinc finger protein 6 isoform X3 [Mastacembelus armatus]|uniref:AN1-type zinc finger protein 6 isoform X3 n=1 Tax=Mastacembelus armatus TaxID=205130 RepID=UPI000E4646FE|nr:AN1-type zinc finger protein 6 isoform X3 [Mastacembelus armatus]
MCREEEKEVQTGDLGRKLRKDMAQETNQSQAPLLCSTGCGSYGSSRNNGMCSLCHKDSLQRQNSNGCMSPAGSSTDSSTEESHQAQCPDSSPAGVSSADTEPAHCSVPTINSATSPEESTSGEKTCLTVNYLQTSQADVTVCTPVETQRKAKRSRCFTCRKKVGLIDRVQHSGLC